MIAAMALKEKQIQQNYRPTIAVHKWFARRPGTLFRGLLLSEFSEEPLADTFSRANDFPRSLSDLAPTNSLCKTGTGEVRENGDKHVTPHRSKPARRGVAWC